MSDLPVILCVTGRRCVVVGGGAVACRRAGSLRDAGADVVVIARRIEPEHERVLTGLGVEIERRPYQQGDLKGAMLVVIATDDLEVNRQVAQEARASGVLINRADEPSEGDLMIPAHAHHGPVTVAVYTGGASSSAAGAIRRELSAALDEDWPKLLEIVGPYREVIRRDVLTPTLRRERLAALGGESAMATLKRDGLEGLRRYCDEIVGGPNES